LLLAGYALGLVMACGARSALDAGPLVPPPPECDVDADCPGHDDLCKPIRCVDSKNYKDKLPAVPAGVLLPPRVCFAADGVKCDDADPCTADSCDAKTGMCGHSPATPDLDKDGHRAPLPGHKAGDAGSCGDDCNDASEAAFPGNPEVCDGVDNDCNGVVDDGAQFVPLDQEPVRISGNIAPAGPGGLAFGEDSYLAIYWGSTEGGTDVYETRLDASGKKVDPIEQRIVLTNADSGGGPIVWIGDRYGLAWQDRRDNDYEIYFTELGPDGKKVMADRRLCAADNFSVNPDIAWNGSEFVVAWQDKRNGEFQVFAQRVALDGTPQGANVVLSTEKLDGSDEEAPNLASGKKTIGLVYAEGGVGVQEIRFKSFEQTTLKYVAGPKTVSKTGVDSVGPQVVWNEDRYVIAWYERTGSTPAVFAATVDEQGNVLTPRTAVSAPPAGKRSRYPQLLPLGDRLLFVYSDDRDANQGYELYSRMLSSSLMPITAETRLTKAAFHSIYPIPAFGPKGDVGILFEDDRSGGEHHVYFTRLGCVTK
jgi:hypothetical protein